MSRINRAPETEMQAMANYKILIAALEKAGVAAGSIEPTRLSKGSPAETFDLLQKIFKLSDAVATATPRGLAQLDANALDSGNRRGAAGSKRKMPPLSGGAEAGGSKRPSKAESVASITSAAESVAPSAPPEPSAVEQILKQQLEEARSELDSSKKAQHALEEEVAFYVSKLERIEDACNVCAQGKLAEVVIKLLSAEEGERVSVGGHA